MSTNAELWPVNGVARIEPDNRGIVLNPDAPSDDFYFPVSHPLVKHLLGKLLTHIEAMNLPERAEAANKSLVRQTLNTWFAEVQENSITSYRGCLGPIAVIRDRDGADRKHVWIQGGENSCAVSINV